MSSQNDSPPTADEGDADHKFLEGQPNEAPENEDQVYISFRMLRANQLQGRE